MAVKVKVLIFCALTSIIFFKFLLDHYHGVPKNNYKENLARFEKLIKHGKTVIGSYDTIYEVHTRGRRPVHRTVSIFYNYSVDGKLYRKEAILPEVPKNQLFELVYLPEDPNIHAKSPEEDYERIKRIINKENDSPLSLWIMLLVALGIIIYLIKDIRYDIRMQREAEEMLRNYRESEMKQAAQDIN